MQAGGVVEQGHVRLVAVQAVLPPFAQYVTVAPDRRTVKADIGTLQTGRDDAQGRWRQLALIADFLQEAIELAGVVEHQLIGKAQLAQVVEQQALIGRLFIQLSVRGLPATGAQQPNGGRAAVRRGRVEIVENHVHLAE